jgi:hypothetical protein
MNIIGQNEKSFLPAIYFNAGAKLRFSTAISFDEQACKLRIRRSLERLKWCAGIY